MALNSLSFLVQYQTHLDYEKYEPFTLSHQRDLTARDCYDGLIISHISSRPHLKIIIVWKVFPILKLNDVV